MPEPIRRFVHFVDRFNRTVGRIAMYLIVVLLAILLYSAFSKATFEISPIWTVEMVQFTLTTYYMLGGAFSLQNGAHVRMDLFYSNWSPRTRALVDTVTIFALILYLTVLLLGGVESTLYAFENGQRRPSAWGPALWPVRLIMCVGVAMMLMQALAILFKDLAAVRGETI